MTLVILIAIMFFLCLALYKPGFKFFLLWLAICAAAFFLVHRSAGIWGFLCYLIIFGGKEEKTSPSKFADKSSCTNPMPKVSNNPSGHRGSAYHTGSDITYISNGNSFVRYGNTAYYANGIYSVKEDNITYYLSDGGVRLGYRVDRDNGVHTYFDDNGKEIGHSYTNGKITNFMGDCFEFR